MTYLIYELQYLTPKVTSVEQSPFKVTRN